jgi:hypothetical protein
MPGIPAFFMINKTNKTYIGWVPTILGRLSWTLIGIVSQRGHVSRFPKDQNGVFIVHQRRDLGDAYFKRVRSAFNWFKSEVFGSLGLETTNTIFNYYCVAVKDGEVLKGRVLTTTARNTVISDWIDEEKKKNPTLDEIQLAQTISDKVKNFVLAHNENVKNRDYGRFKNRAIHSTEFVLKRNGIAKITVVPAVESPEADSSTDYSDQSVLNLAEQAFYFLRDISHIHQHHSSTSECQINLRECDPENSWAENIHKDLQRAIVHARRAKSDPTALHNALGITQYIRSFEKISELEKFDIVKPLNWDLLERSVKSERDKSRLHSGHSDKLFTGLMGTFALIVAVAGSYHLMHAAENIGKKLTANFLPPISFLAHRIFEWGPTNEDKFYTSLIWGFIAVLLPFSLSHRIRISINQNCWALVLYFTRPLIYDSKYPIFRTMKGLIGVSLFLALPIYFFYTRILGH